MVTYGNKHQSTPWAIQPVVIDGVQPIACIFCVKPSFTTCIEFDMYFHLYINHKSELSRLTRRWNLEDNISYAVNEGKGVAGLIPSPTYQSKPDFTSLDLELRTAEARFISENRFDSHLPEMEVKVDE